MMNPFDLPGPQFLLFYLVFGGLVCFSLAIWIKQIESRNAQPVLSMSGDPYQIAYLRAGAAEALNLTTIALVDRGLLALSDDGRLLHTTRPDAGQVVSRSIEREVLAFFERAQSAQALLARSSGVKALAVYHTAMVADGLLTGPGLLMKRLFPVGATLVMLLGVSWVKFNLALARGHDNVMFLLVLTAFFAIYAVMRLFRRSTTRGTALLEDFKRLFSRLKSRAGQIPAGGATNEAALLAAVFGVGALSLATFPFIRKLHTGAASGTDGGADGGTVSDGVGGGGDSGGDSSGGDSSGGCGGGSGGGCGGCGGGGGGD
jgi:uncharacterized protein (TIGR04222 family)